MRRITAACLLLLALAVTGTGQDAAPRKPAARLANADEVRRRLGLVPEYASVPGIETIKIAVLDYGFGGVGERAYLPENAVVVEHYDPEFVRRNNLGDAAFQKAFDPSNRHGRSLAQIVWAVTGAHPKGPQFYLLNANGPTMLRRAVRYAVEQRVDVILFSGSFEGGGNGDGRGPVNRAVTEAVAAGIIWVNAAGNYGRRVYAGPVRVGPDGYLRFRDGADGTSLRFRNRLDENAVTVTLTWNDYREEEDGGTSKDLDLYVEDAAGRRVGTAEKKQVMGKAAGPDESRNPRERVVLTDLPANADQNYRVRVQARAGNFTATDRLRVLITAARETYVAPGSDTPEEAVKFFDATGREELFPPADHPQVLTVGDTSPESAVGPTADYRLKPDVLLEDSRAFFSDGQVTAGSSNAAAYFAGVVAVLKAAQPGLGTRHLMRLARQDAAVVARSGLAVTQPALPERLAPPAAKVKVTGPRGGTLDLQFSGTRVSSFLNPSQATTNRTPAGASPLAGLRAVRPEVPASLDSRIWRTPSRGRLAEVMRDVR